MAESKELTKQEAAAWLSDYEELCREHGIYLVMEGDGWLQRSDNNQEDTELAVESLKETVLRDII